MDHEHSDLSLSTFNLHINGQHFSFSPAYYFGTSPDTELCQIYTSPSWGWLNQHHTRASISQPQFNTTNTMDEASAGNVANCFRNFLHTTHVLMPQRASMGGSGKLLSLSHHCHGPCCTCSVASNTTNHV